LSKYVIVDAVSQFKIKYCIEIEDSIEDGKILDHVEKQIKDENVLEFTQEHMGETVADYVVLNKDEAIEKFRSFAPYFSDWSAERISKLITPIDFDRKEYDRQEDLKWKKKLI
tara:strand:- start:206 stop:544 length:339 start_codon:yes stop_codon:yes gene_type:complete